jgi:hypothetical protein
MNLLTRCAPGVVLIGTFAFLSNGCSDQYASPVQPFALPSHLVNLEASQVGAHLDAQWALLARDQIPGWAGHYFTNDR